MAEQLPIQFEFRGQYQFANFYPGSNAEIIEHLQDFLYSGRQQQIFLWGNSGHGKTHLLQACCQAAHELGAQAFYLSFSLDRLNPSILDGLENVDIVCLDDVDTIIGDLTWEKALFNFYNAHRENGHRLLLASGMALSQLTFQLPDLQTRFGWGLSLKLQALDEAQTLAALTAQATERGFDIPRHVGQFLLKHYDRDLSKLWKTLDKIDQTTLSAQRKLTIPLLKRIMTEDDG